MGIYGESAHKLLEAENNDKIEQNPINGLDTLRNDQGKIVPVQKQEQPKVEPTPEPQYNPDEDEFDKQTREEEMKKADEENKP